MGWPGPAMEFPFDTTRTAADLVFSGALLRYPGICWILPHAGGTLLQMAERLTRMSNTFAGQSWLQSKYPGAPGDSGQVRESFLRLNLDLCWNTHSPVLASLVDFIGAEHLLFGTDSPISPMAARDLALLDESTAIGADVKALLRRGNALRLFPGLAARIGAP